MTAATRQALIGLRDFSTLQWYVIPFLAFVFFLYTMEIKKARTGGDWNPVFAAAAIFGADFFNESWNGWFMILSGMRAMDDAWPHGAPDNRGLEHRDHVHVRHPRVRLLPQPLEQTQGQAARHPGEMVLRYPPTRSSASSSSAASTRAASSSGRIPSGDEASRP